LSLINKTDDKYFKEKHQVYTQFLNALNAKFDANTFQANKAEIEKIMITILKTFPDNVDFNNLLNLKPIQEVSKSNQPLHQLFEISLNGDYKQYQNWKSQNDKFLSQ